MALTGEFPLMYREAEIERIVAELQGPVPVAFVVAGPAGVGKTRMAAEVARDAATKGFAPAGGRDARVGRDTVRSVRGVPAASGQSAGDLLGLMRQAIDAIAGRASRDRGCC